MARRKKKENARNLFPDDFVIAVESGGAWENAFARRAGILFAEAGVFQRKLVRVGVIFRLYRYAAPDNNLGLVSCARKAKNPIGIPRRRDRKA